MYVWFAAFWSLKLGLHFKSAHRPEPTNAATSAFASSSIGSRASGFCARGAERTTRAVTWREACGNLSTCGGSAPGGSTSVTGERGVEAGAYAAAAAAVETDSVFGALSQLLGEDDARGGGDGDGECFSTPRASAAPLTPFGTPSEGIPPCTDEGEVVD